MKLSTDVIVVGAGASGIPAAVAAARTGASVLLLEDDLALGGAPVDNYITMPCGFPRSGIYAEIVSALDARHRLPSKPNANGVRAEDWYLPWAYSVVLDDLTSAEPNLRVMCGARVTRPIVTEAAGRPRVTGVFVARPDGSEMRIDAPVVIDAAGGGDLSVQAGCEERFGRDAQSDFDEPHAPPAADNVVQQCTLMFLSQRIGSRPFDMRELQVVGMIDPGFGWVALGPEEFVGRDTGFYLHWGCTVQPSDVRDPLALADAQAEAWRKIRPDLEYLLAHDFFAYVAPRLGVRETRRIVGEHVLTENDLRRGGFPDDTLAVGGWHLDLWMPGRKLDPSEREVPYYGIPYRCMVPRGVDGLLLAGKILSGSHVAMSSYRVQPTVAMAGQAAGVAAALCAQRHAQPRDLDAKAIREILTGPGQNVDLSPEPA